MMGLKISLEEFDLDMDMLSSDEMIQGSMIVLGSNKYKGVFSPYNTLELTIGDWWCLNQCYHENHEKTRILVETGVIASYGDTLEYLDLNHYHI